MNFAKAMFLCLSVSCSQGVSASVHAGIHTPCSRHSPGPDKPLGAVTSPGVGTPQGADTFREQTPPPRSRQPPPRPQCMSGDTGKKRAVGILLECIFVKNEPTCLSRHYSTVKKLNSNVHGQPEVSPKLIESRIKINNCLLNKAFLCILQQ